MTETPIYRYEASRKSFVQDSSILANLKLKDNEEIRITRIYHINKPYQEAPSPVVSKQSLRELKTQQNKATRAALKEEKEFIESVYGSNEPSEASSDNEDDNLSIISNAGSEKKIRKKRNQVKITERNQRKRYSLPYFDSCPVCEANYRAYAGTRKSLPSLLPPIQVEYKIDSPTKGKRVFSPKLYDPSAVAFAQASRASLKPKIDSHAHAHLKLEKQNHISKNLNQKKDHLSYKQLFKNRQNLIGFTYEKFNPKASSRRYEF